MGSIDRDRAGQVPATDSLARVQAELAQTFAGVDAVQVERVSAMLQEPPRRWFVTGQGRSRLVGSMIAMRLMHLGLPAVMVGEATAPSIQAGDVLLVLSASGETPVTLHLARRALDLGASIVAITGRADSTLTGLAEAVVHLPVAGSTQFGGSRFEQAALLLADALVLEVTHADPRAYAEMAHRHTNLE